MSGVGAADVATHLSRYMSARCVQVAQKRLEKPFKPCGGIKDRLSMSTVNPYQYDARPPPDLDFTLFD
jgi:hypothetical protein